MPPSFQENTLAKADAAKPLLLMGSPEGGKNVVSFNQDVYIYRGILTATAQCAYELKTGRGLWIQMVKGKITVNGQELSTGDGAAIENISDVRINALNNSEFLMFDLA